MRQLLHAFFFCTLLPVVHAAAQPPAGRPDHPGDLVDRAATARWTRGGGERLTFNEPDTRRHRLGLAGYAKRVTLENDKDYARVLSTHPEWIPKGSVIGHFDGLYIPANHKFRAEVGFIRGAAASDGVTFAVDVLTDRGKTLHQLASVRARYDDRTDILEADLSKFGGQTVTIRLGTHAGASSGQDWAVWTFARVEPRPAGGAAPGSGTRVTVPVPPRPTPVPPRAGGRGGRGSASGGIGILLPGAVAMLRREILMFPPAPPPADVTAIVALEPVVGEADLPLRTIRNRLYRSGRSGEYYYLPDALRLARDRESGWRVGAVWTSDQKIRVTLLLRTDVDPGELAFVKRVVTSRYGATARLLPLPVSSARLTIEGREDWEIERPEFSSLDADVPLVFTMSPESFADFKASLETEGYPAAFVLTTGEQQNEVTAQISLRHPTGRPYSALTEVAFGSVARAGRQLVIHDVRNHLDFPITIDAVDVEIRFPDWTAAESYTGVPVEPAVTIPPGAKATLIAAVRASPRLEAKLRSLGAAAPTEETADRGSGGVRGILERFLAELAKGRASPDASDAMRRAGPADGGPIPALTSATQRYGLRISQIDFSCQECLDAIWSRVEVATYLDRLARLEIEALASAFEGEYGAGRRLDRLTVDLRSTSLMREGRGDGTEGLKTISLSRERLKDQSVIVFLPDTTGDPVRIRYRITTLFSDGTRAAARDWSTLEDTLGLIIARSDVEQVIRDH